MSSHSELLNANQLNHIAIIMDGNNRWAKHHGLRGIAGHKAGIERLRDMLDGCKEHGINIVTVFAFSSENWKRPPLEVKALMSLFYDYLHREAKKLKKENVSLRVIGRRDRFDKKLIQTIEKAEALTAGGERTLVIAADYGGKWDITNAAKAILETAKVSHVELDEEIFNRYTSLSDFPPVDCLVRTGGEYRISNFLLWQSAYAELYFSDVLWPDFDKDELNKVVVEFSKRQRRFGMKSEQVELNQATLSGNKNA